MLEPEDTLDDLDERAFADDLRAIERHYAKPKATRRRKLARVALLLLAILFCWHVVSVVIHKRASAQRRARQRAAVAICADYADVNDCPAYQRASQ